MAITVAELPGYLSALGERAGQEAPIRAVNAMAQAYQRVVVESMHGDPPSPPGTPPARRTGTLARSVRVAPARMTGAYQASNSVAPHTVYARIQQLGGHIYPKHTLRGGPREAGASHSPYAYSDLGYLRFETASGVHYARHVYLPPRPYMVMEPDTRTAVHQAAVDAVQALLP